MSCPSEKAGGSRVSSKSLNSVFQTDTNLTTILKESAVPLVTTVAPKARFAEHRSRQPISSLKYRGTFASKVSCSPVTGCLKEIDLACSARRLWALFPFPYLLVAHNRVPDIGKMYANLVFPARQEINFQ